MTNEERVELLALQEENRRLRIEAREYKRVLYEICEAARMHVHLVVPYLRGMPGDNHPVMKSGDSLRGQIDRAAHVHVYINSLVRYEK